jgi:beta-glucosidase/6-phospho-beta-glucosidase/beta-galactosidase
MQAFISSYHFSTYKKKFHHYRFSISWPRVLINGSVINPLGIDYYNRLIDSLLENDIHPVVTLYHWDLPQTIQELGGFLNPDFVGYFKHYADVLFEKFGDRVTKWITFNEPHKFCVDGYGTGEMAPGVKLSGIGEYLCAHHVLQAHAAVYQLYKTKYYRTQKGEIGISLVSRSFYVNDKSEANLIDDMQNFQVSIQHFNMSYYDNLFAIFLLQKARLVCESNLWTRWWLSSSNDR